MIKRILPFFAALFALTGCSSASLLNVVIPNGGYTVHKDIAYGENPRQKLDVYVPDKPDASKSVIVFFYGGSWQKGTKDLYKFVGQAFTSKGYTVVVADYRTYPEVYFPAFIEDGANAIAWVHSHIEEYGGDPANMYLMGHSAGGHIALMLTLNESYLKAVGGNSKWVKGAIGIAGPYDFLPFTDPNIKALFSKSPDEDTQPIHFVRYHTPPILLLTAEQDEEVGAKNARNLANRLRESNDPVQEIVYPDVGHIGIVLSLAYGFRGKAPALEDIDAFIKKTNGD